MTPERPEGRAGGAEPVLPAWAASEPARPATVEVDPLLRSRRFFDLYRFALAVIFVLLPMMFEGSIAFASQDPGLYYLVAAGYALVAVYLLASSVVSPTRARDLMGPVTLDILALTLLMHASGGAKSELGYMLFVPLAAAGLIGEGRTTLFFAALATVAVLLEQAYRSSGRGGDLAEFVQVGTMGIGFFAIAISARLLARRVLANQRLARERGIALQQQQQVAELIIRDMQDGVLVLDRAGRLRQFNPRAVSLLAMSPQVGQPVGLLIPELAEAFQRWQSCHGERRFVVRQGHGETGLGVRLVPAPGAGGVVAYLEDLSRVQEQARQLKLAALGRLTASIAHEIRNPLSAITQAAELLPDERRSDLRERLIQIIRDHAARLERMVRDILELGRRDRAQPQANELPEFLDAFRASFALQSGCPHDRIELVIDPALEEGAKLWFDRTHLNQVLWNLLHNALRHASERAGAIRLSAFPTGSGCEIHVCDDGAGVDQVSRAHLFEPFFTTDSRGTGLGLYIARELCEANGATLEYVDNAPGAHFRIRSSSMS